MIDIRFAMPAVGSLLRLGLLAAALALIAAACTSGDDTDATTAPAESVTAEAPVASEAPAATDAPAASADAAPTAAPAAAPTGASGLDFGSGSGSITLGDETFEFAIGPGAGVCRDVFGIILASGTVADGRDIEGDFAIPPLDWETYTDGRYEPPSVELEITSTGDDNARWRADAGWAQESGKVGMSQVDSYEKDGRSAAGLATFANAWNSDAESVQGSFEISCAEG